MMFAPLTLGNLTIVDPSTRMTMVDDPNEYKPQPRACEDFAFIAQRLREIERDKAEAMRRDPDAPEAWA